MDNFQVALPYNGTSGWSGTDTSAERAFLRDSGEATKTTQRETIRFLQEQKQFGVTWKELADEFGWHHGTASGVLSVLHKDEQIARLLSKRDKCRVYVHPDYVDGRETDTQGRKAKTCPNCGHSL